MIYKNVLSTVLKKQEPVFEFEKMAKEYFAEFFNQLDPEAEMNPENGDVEDDMCHKEKNFDVSISDEVYISFTLKASYNVERDFGDRETEPSYEEHLNTAYITNFENNTGFDEDEMLENTNIDAEL